MKAIILAAGRGSRLAGRTQDAPKCLARLAGKTLLDWQLSALSEAGVEDIAVVGGYMVEKLRALCAGPVPFIVLENPRWAETNMLVSLACAAEWSAGAETVISYSDIVYPARHVRPLLARAEPLSLTYDRLWEKLWSFRQNGNPLEDAETFRQEDGILKEIGAKPRGLGEVQGQYMGVLKFTPESWQIWNKRLATLGPAADRTDMTGFLRLLLADGVKIGAAAVDGAWCEADTERDLDLYEAALNAGHFSHDWRY